MISEIPQGSKINIQGLECYIPQPGYVVNIKTGQLEHRGIYSRSDIKEEQYWERIALPLWYKEVMKKWEDYDKKKTDDSDEFYDERLEKYKEQEWDRRLNGFWYLNNGEPVYLTGMHYMYLQWWQIDIGYVRFRITDLEYFYFLQYCLEDRNCMGMLEITKRRFGKTFRGGLFIYEYVSRTKKTNGGIQSKTGQDAKKLYNKAVINPFITLPKFFRPEYDMSGGLRPKTALSFQQTNIKGKKAESRLDREELGSLIDHEDAAILAYDGQKIHRYFSDEWAKTIEVNIYDRHEVIRYCLVDDEGNIIGKALYSSTVEKIETDREGVQEGAKQLWDESDHTRRDERGRTPSGLFRFFMTADRSKNFDKYGYPDVEKTIKEILADRESVKHNLRALSARRHKEPRTINEAFSSDADKSIFNTDNIDKRGHELIAAPIPLRKIIYYRDLDQTVKWRDIIQSDGDFYWEVSPDFDLSPKKDVFKIQDKLRCPTRTDKGAISVDSYSNSQGGRKYGSKASAWYGDRDLFKATAHLYGRPKVKEDLHTQVLLCAEYMGVKAYYEFTADDFLSFFRDRGRIKYLGKFPLSLIDPVQIKKAGPQGPDRFYGTPITPFSLTKQHDNGIAYFEYHCHLIDFPIILEKAPTFNPYDRTVSDTMVSFLILISILMEPIRKPAPPKEPLVRSWVNEYYQGN